jgi:RNA polymerase sigma factor (sigma-70 family)
MDDGALVADFLARRPEGLARAYDAYAAELCSVARSVLGERERAQDCVHDALLRVWRRPGSYDPARGSLRAFLCGCVRNEALGELRRASRQAERERRASRGEALQEELPLIDHVEAARVRDAIARLPEAQRDAIVRAYYGNRSQSEIAAETQTPLGTVKSRVSTAMLKLASELRELRLA